jgi:hypothetical protein
LFARGFDDGDVAGGSYALVTAFEVFEHLPQPLDDIRQMLTFSRNLLFSTLLVPDPPPPPASWWYYALEGGQHVALYSRTALERLAARLGLHLATYRQRWHLLTENAKAARRFGWACWVGRSRWLQPLWRSKRSLLAQDYERLTGRPLS